MFQRGTAEKSRNSSGKILPFVGNITLLHKHRIIYIDRYIYRLLLHRLEIKRI